MDKERVDTYKIRYRRGTLLNQGGNANVYRCEKIDTGEKFAIKILLPDISKEKQKRFANEILAMQKFGGIENGVLPILDADAENGWYVMPIATPIEEYFLDTQAGVKEKIEAVAQLAQSLEVLHLFGITHRDIKPDNLFRYKDQYCIGDFGLCEYPEGIDVDTGNNRQLGAFNTLAPEMYTDPKGQDGKKADVYSLAKTLWILLTGEPKGFTGPYSSEDSKFSFAHYPLLKDQPLAVIELLLQYATDNEPRRRMPLGEFRKVLNTWIEHADDSRYLQHFEWYLLMNHIALETQIGLRYIFDKEQIIDVLNMIKNHKILNHVMIPQGGGLDFVSAEQANEEGCIYLNLQGETILVRPKALVIATYNKSDWNFILLETEEQAPVISEHDDYEELVVEDYPAHYVSGRYAHYGVYDYDTGEKLPEGSKVLIRQLKGSFMIVPKQGGYNAINGTYDGRHDKMTVMELYQYIGEIIKGKKPEIEFDPKPIKAEERHPAPLGFAKQYIEEVKVKIKPTKPLAESRISFAFYVDVQLAHSPMDFIYGIKTYLTKEGEFRKHKETDEDIYRVYSREEAIELAKSMRQQFGAYYKERGYDFGSNDCPVSITLRREGEMEPRRFTLESIKKLMREADDRVNNRLAIDEYGRPQLLQNIHFADLYPVTQGTWCADKNHVGKYSSLSDAEDSYRYMLQGWLEYITNSAQTNVVVASEDIEELEKAIEECYNEQMNNK